MLSSRELLSFAARAPVSFDHLGSSCKPDHQVCMTSRSPSVPPSEPPSETTLASSKLLRSLLRRLLRTVRLHFGSAGSLFKNRCCPLSFQLQDGGSSTRARVPSPTFP